MYLSQTVTKPVRSAVPTFEPITLDEAKNQIGMAVTVSSHDAMLTGLIQAARETVEADTDIAIATGTYTWKLSEWPCTDYIEIPLRPVTSITSITYVDTAGTSQTWTSTYYSLETSPVQPVVRLTYGNTYPALRGDMNGITITFVAGYAAENSIPARIKQACLLLVSHWFENRSVVGVVGDEIALSYQALVDRLGRKTYP